MSKEYIEKADLYKWAAEREETARNWARDTPTNSPAYMRYVSQLNERTAFKHHIADIPAADVVEVRHARWIVCEDLFGENGYCSACGFLMGVNEPGNGFPDVENLKYCPNCGAKMDGGVNDDNNL